VVFDSHAPAVIAAHDPQAQTAAQALARRLLERTPSYGEAQRALPQGPVLLVGTDADVEAVLMRQGLAGPPPSIAGHGTARAWAVNRPGKGTLVVVSGHDATALADMTAPLPHYGSDGFVVFDGRRTIDRGVWPSGPDPLCLNLASEGDG
jgi:aminopeptidase N